MRPHHLIEQWDRLMICCSDASARKAAELLAKAVTFDFGVVDLDPVLIDFGAGLRKRGLFRLPYPVVFYSASISAEKDVLWTGERRSEPSGRPRVVSVLASQDAQGCEYFMFTGPFDDFDYAALDCRIWWIVEAPHLCMYEMGDDGDNRVIREGDIGTGAVPSIALRALEGLTSLFVSGETVRTTTPAPAKLNAARVRKGRPPINDLVTVRLRERRTEHHPSGGSHASPILHWRRGHFRTLRHDRFGTERVVPVAPCLVGANEEAHDLIPRDYVVKQPL